MFSVLLPVLIAMGPIVNEPSSSQLEFFGDDVGVRMTKVPVAGNPGAFEFVEQFFVRGETGNWKAVLSSPTHPDVARLTRVAESSLLKRTGAGLFASAPSHSFESCSLSKKGQGSEFLLRRVSEGVTLTKRVWAPQKGRQIKVSLQAEFPTNGQRIEYFLDSYAFTPDRKPLSGAGKPDSTFSPGLRPKEGQVVGDHFYRAPVISAQRGPLAALILPDLDVLADNRPMATILDLDAANGVVDATLMSYGFAEHELAGHVYFVHDASMTKRVPKTLLLAYDLVLDGNAEPFGAYRQAVDFTWERYGNANFEKVLPQAMPFEEYAKFCYPAVFKEAYGSNKLGWFEVEIDGQVCGGVPAGWGFTNGWVSWQCWFNQLRSAWGLRWWGKKLDNAEWVDKADKMLNLALAAPMDRGAVPTTYLSREKQWRGCLIMPRQDCYYDLTNMAWKGIWMLRWLEFEDCPRREEILRQCREMAELMMRFQNGDSSFPTWLTKEHEVVPILDHSAQSALPAWFLAEYVSTWSDLVGRVAAAQKAGRADPLSEVEAKELGRIADTVARAKQSAHRAAGFLVTNVIDQQRYYDFETFFSCSPKQCLQANGALDDVAMHDPHTLSPPQNTLCMQWAAEALWKVAELTEGPIASSGTPRPPSYELRKHALKALDIMALYQNVWSVSFRKAAYTFGGFGVQNSDGEYLDARQAQFGCTLADFGATLGRRDYFERGVAAARASMTLINHPLHVELNLYPNPNYPPGLQPENTGHGGTDQQNGRTGFDWGEGSGLAAIAWLLDKYGDVYIDDQEKWAVGIDGAIPSEGGKVAYDAVDYSARTTQAPRRRIEVRRRSGSKSQIVAGIYPHLISAALQMRPGTSSTPNEIGISADFVGLAPEEFSGHFVAEGGDRAVAYSVRSGPEQPGALRTSLRADFTPDWNGKPIRLVGKWRGLDFSAGPWVFYVDPAFDFSDWRMPGWEVQGNFAETPTYSTRMNFGVAPGEAFIGTCENGKGGYDDTYTGRITSPPFLLTKPKMRLLVGGGSGSNVYVALVDGKGKELEVARGQNSERMREVVWDVAKHLGKKLRLLIVDEETGGWGHINVGRVRCADE
ncbi:MAG: hypothetical protein CNCCGFBP_02067 [Fimbriimonadaceae bacterium]|nr:hypothetical protein [Fimbriimonadaceae bacterium]